MNLLKGLFLSMAWLVYLAGRVILLGALLIAGLLA